MRRHHPIRLFLALIVLSSPSCLCVAEFPDYEGNRDGSSTQASGSESTTAAGTAVVRDDLYVFLQQEDPFMIDASVGVLINDTLPSPDTTATNTHVRSKRGFEYEIYPEGGALYSPTSRFWGEDSFVYSLLGDIEQATARVIVRPITIELSEVTKNLGGYKANGLLGRDSVGWVATGIGDFNGDGIDDVLVGNPTGIANDTDPGVCYIIFGSEELRNLLLPEISAEGRGVVINGEDTNDAACHSAAPVGDMNLDGLPDVIIGAPHAGPQDAGRAYVVFGSSEARAIELSDVTAGQGGFVIEGSNNGDEVGWSVASAGRMLGGDAPDIIIGARRAGGAGRAYVIRGKSNTAPVMLADIESEANDAGFVIIGEDDGDRVGETVAGQIDIDGDGRDDVIIGAPMASYAGATSGRVYVVFGREEPATVNLADIAAEMGRGYVVDGPVAGAQLGISLDPAGDINDDGLGDFLVGTNHNQEQDDEGVAFVVLGKDDERDIQLSEIDGGNDALEFTKAVAGGAARTAVACVGDIDGDGNIDFAAGSERSDTPVSVGTADDVGVTYVVYGGTTMTSSSLLDIADGDRGFELVGENPGDRAGYTVRAAGDINNDGLGDIILGAPGVDPGGRAYVILGVPSGS